MGKGNLDYAVLGSIDSLNPFLARTTAERTAIGMIYETLAVYEEGELVPRLAESWKEDPANLQIVFQIRQGVKWHDGTNLTAEDVAFTFNYVLEKRLPMWIIMAFVRSAEATDPYTVVINLTRYSPVVLAMMAPAIPIIPKHIWSQVEVPMAFPNTEEAIATGRFRLREFAHGRYVLLENTGFYWGAYLSFTLLLYTWSQLTRQGF